ncbi:MAG: hypothetical protein ABL921_31450 [Pirellula sp.]
MVHIRENRFSEAWKSITSPSKDQAIVPDSIKIGKERIKLWLLLEAGAAAQAEPQFKRLVTMSLSVDSASGDQATSCGFIGGVVGMLQADGAASYIPLPVLEKAKEQLLARVESKNAKAKLEQKLYETSQWRAELSTLVSKFESIGIEKSDKQNRSIQAEFERTKQEQLELLDDLKSARGEKNILEDQRKKWIQNRKSILAQMNTETPGKPAFPVPPGPAPHQPVRPRGSYRIDPKTQESKYVPPSDSEERRYRDDLKTYDERAKKWRQRGAEYQRDLQEYPAKKQLWDEKDAARRASLQSQMAAIESGFAATEKAIQDMQEDTKQGVGKDLKQTGEQLDQMKRSAAISSIAYRNVASTDTKPKHLNRPSNFQLLDYVSECAQLRKSLR